MRLRFILLLLLLASLLALITLLPRNPRVLGWLWNGAGSFAANYGYTLGADSISGNALAGVTVTGLRVDGPGVQLTTDSADLRYGLFSLVFGKPSIAVDLAGVRGNIDPSAFEQLFDNEGGGEHAALELPVDLQRLTLDDIALTVNEFELYLPQLALNELTVTTGTEGVELHGSLTTQDGDASFGGLWQLDEGRLDLDIYEADVAVARHWWDGATGGTLTGTLTATSAGVELDTYIEDGTIDYLEVQVTDISGPVTMHDLVVRGDLTGQGLGGTVQADVLVDIDAENYRGTLSGAARLEEAVPWLGRTLDLDLSGIPSSGPMDLQVLMTGWRTTLVTGQANGTGELAGLPLTSLHGSFGYQKETGISVDASALWSGGSMGLQLLPYGIGVSELTFLLDGVQPFPAIDSLALDASGSVHFDRVSDTPPASAITAELRGSLAGSPLELAMTAGSSDTFRWQADVNGSGLAQGVTANADLDFAAGTVSGDATAAALELPGFAWPVSASANVNGASFKLPLPLTAAANAGPLSLDPLQLLVALPDGPIVTAADGSFAVGSTAAGLSLTADGPPLLLELAEGFSLRPELAGELELAGGELRPDLTASLAGLNLELGSAEDGTLTGTLGGAEDQLELEYRQADGSWQLQGGLPVAELGALLGVELAGDLQGRATGNAADLAQVDFSGAVTLAGVPVELQLQQSGDGLALEAAATALGADWQAAGLVWPLQELSLSSDIGSVTLRDGVIAGNGGLSLPAGLLLLTSDSARSSLDWQLAGTLEESSLQLTAGASTARLDWSDGLQITAAVQEQLGLAALPGMQAQLQAGLDPDGAITGQIGLPGGALQLTGDLQGGSANLTGTLPAAGLSELLAGAINLDADLTWLNGPELTGTADWNGLGADLNWSSGQGLSAQVAADGLTGNLDSEQLLLNLDGFDPLPFLSVGLPLESLPLHGTAGGSYSGDVTVDLNGTSGPLALNLTGSPTEGLDLQADLLDGLLSAEGRFEASGGNPVLTGVLRSAELSASDYVSVPAHEFTIDYRDGVASLSGEGNTLSIADGAVAGSAVINLDLLGQAHKLTVRPDGGTGLSGELAGPLASGGLQLSDALAVQLRLNGSPPAPLDFLSGATLEGRLELTGNWSAHLQAEADGPLPQFSPLTFGANLEGTLQELTATGNLRQGPGAERLLTVQAQAGGNGLQINSDLASLDLNSIAAALGLDGAIQPTGLASLQWHPGLAPVWQLDGRLDGALANQPLAVAVGGSPEGLQLSGSVAGNELSASMQADDLAASWGDFAVRVSSHGGSLDGPWAFGTLPLSLDNSNGLQLTTTLYGLNISAGSGDSGLGISISGTPDGTQLPLDLSWTTSAGFEGGGSGAIALADYGDVPVQVTSQADGSLSLSAGMTGPFTADLAANLDRSPWGTEALTGTISASLNVMQLAGIPASGGSGLSLSGRLAGNLFQPQASGSVVSLGMFDAAGRLTADLGGAVLTLGGEHLDLQASADFSGWQAALTLDQQQLERLEDLLPDSSVSLQATATGDWTMPGTSAELTDLILHHAQASASGDADFTNGNVNARLDLHVPLFAFGNGLGLTGLADGSVQLNGFNPAEPGSGRLTGQVDLSGVGINGQGNLSGQITAMGTVRQPSLAARLTEGGQDDQALSLDWQPAASRFQLRSQLEFGAVATDLNVLASPTTGQIASGSITVPGGGFDLSDTTTGEFRLDGNGGFAGWLAVIDPDATTLSVTGDLAGLGAQFGGRLQLLARNAANGLEFSGGLTGLSLLGSNLGDVTIGTVTRNGRGVSLNGANLRGSVSLSGDWQLDRLALEPSPEISVVASAAGNLAGGNLNATMSGRLLGSPATGTAAAGLGPQGISVQADLQALGGNVTLDAQYIRSAWQGVVELAGLSYSGVNLSGNGTVWGELGSPLLELQTEANLLGLSGSGSLALGANRLELHQTLLGGNLPGPVVLQGSLTPVAELRITGPDGNSFRLEQANSDSTRPLLERRLVSSGHATLSGNAVAVDLSAGSDGESADIAIALPVLDGLAVRGSMQLASLRAFLEQLEDGVELHGRAGTFGTMVLQPLAGRMQLSEFGLDSSLGRIELSGEMGLAGDSRLSGSFVPAAGIVADLPPLSGGAEVPFALLSSPDIIRFVSTSAIGDIDADYRLSAGSGSLSARLRSGGGTLRLNAAWSPEHGTSGELTSQDFVLFEPPGGARGVLDAGLNLSEGRAVGDAELQLGSGRFSAAFDWGLADLLPAGLAVRQQTGGNLELRVGSFELSELPFVARWAPALSGGITAVVQVRDNVVAGNLVANGLNAAGSPLPVEALISGSPAQLEVGATIAGSPLSLTFEDGVLAGLLELRRFPLHTLAEALAGPLDATAEVTGVARFSLPLADVSQSEVRLATEQVRFERGGVVTSGNVSMELSSGVLEVSQASFSGAGSWEAGGVLRADELDFNLQAMDADFGPMLGLIPALNQLGVEAAGTVTLEASGTLAEPVVTLDSQALDFTVAGIPYRLEGLLVALRSSQLTVGAELLARDTIQGRMTLSGSGGLSLAPLAFQDARFEFGGSLVLPFVGALEGIQGAVYSADSSLGAPLLAAIEANLGNAVSVAGSLAPLDLDITGQDLQLDLPSIFLMGTRLNADLNLRQSQGFDLSGAITILESQLTLNRGSGGGVSLGGNLGGDFRFDSLVIDAPARLRLAESFGTAELAGRLTVTGNLAAPVLTGRAEAIRGTFQFGGRDFNLQEAVAEFDVTRGLFPAIDLTATTEIDRNRLLPEASGFQLVAPADGQVSVTLSFHGTIEPDPEAGVRLNLEPLLSSNALVQAPGPDGATGATRPLTEEELLALITLGRTEFSSLGGAAGLAPTVAQGALETAVDLLILSELQRALSEALGLDLVEIRSGALSNLLTGQSEPDQQFGISLRFGGYVSEDVFATYSVSAFDDPEGIYAFSNELGIRYALGPVILNLAGSINLPDQPDRNAMAQLNLSVLYEFNPVTSLEAGFELSSDEQLYRFGVTWRW